ncbi:MAG: DegT/DnrJ/EryC1/StrS family aminotransferase [Pirellulaceae bacterium]|nr:DegT/DnrJ/EryC1/StrS family aminotransferase [Pirellulaceae bacterium]
MESDAGFSRRKFVATTAGAVAASASWSACQASTADTKLALEGGVKAVQAGVPKLQRWGEPERQRLDSMLKQDSLFYWKGPQTTQLIQRFREQCPVQHVMTCSSGTAALHIAVASIGLQPGDEVITSPITDIGTVVGAIYQQGVPVFADLHPHSYNLDPVDVQRKITEKTKAIIVVHLAGNPCDMQAIMSLARQHNLVVIEDCAQSWGAKCQGQPIGSIGHLACFSFQQSKHVTCGDGGIVASRDERFGPLLQRFGDKGMDRLGKSGLFESFATNYRMSEPQAAVAAAQLERVEQIAVRRSQLGDLLQARLQQLPGISTHFVAKGDRATYWFSMLRIDPKVLACDRAQFVKALVAEGVSASAGYIPVPLYGNPVFQNHSFFGGTWPIKQFGLTKMDYTQVQCPEAEAILKTGVRIVIHEGMSDEYMESVAAAVTKVVKHYTLST